MLVWDVSISQHPTDNPQHPRPPSAGGRDAPTLISPSKAPLELGTIVPGPRPWPDDPPREGAARRPPDLHMQMSHGGGGEGHAWSPPVGSLRPRRRSRCLLSLSLFLCAAFRGIKADTVVTRSPEGQRSDFTIPITMISNDVYLAGSDGWELYKRAPLPSPLLGGPWVRRALASTPAGGRCASPGHGAPRRRALGAGRRCRGSGLRGPAPAPGSLRTSLRCSKPRRD